MGAAARQGQYFLAGEIALPLLAVGGIEFGPVIVAGGFKALAWTTATGTVLGTRGMDILRATHARTMMFMQDHPVLMKAIIEYGNYFKGYITPPSPTTNFSEGLGTATSILNSN